jgi:hypothetical protein
MTQLQGPTLSDTRGPARIRKLEEGIAGIDEQITILMDRRYCMQSEIEEIRGGEA